MRAISHERFTPPRLVIQERDAVPQAMFENLELGDAARDALLEQLRAIIAEPKNYIDQGGAGTVYRLTGGVCMKVIHDRRLSEAAYLMDHGNPIEVESAYLRSLAKVEVAGVRTPWCYGFWKSERPDMPSAILMEELDAVNVQHVLNGTEPLPADFDVDIFVEALSNYLDHMHDERGVLHGDLFARNVMIDRATGLPRVIDFGRSVALNRVGPEARVQLVDRELEHFDEIAEALHVLTEA